MNDIKSNTTFWNELVEYKIQVPYYQRDYAQGRVDDGRIDNIRKVFVEELFQAIDGDKVCHLGLVFGSYNEDDKTFIAVDGQQRLTTVFLLHWYVAWREGRLDEYKEFLSGFSWNTRSFSSQFVNLLFNVTRSNDGVIADIQTNKDYFSIWENDPTVKGMITMLQEIEKQYHGKSLCAKLFSPECGIRYDILKLAKGSDGKTYLKMNSRGRSLTTFELFKSKFIDYFKPGFGKKFDNEWLDFMLKMSEKLKNKKQVDELLFGDPDICFMNFINEYTYLKLKLKEKTEETEGIQVFIGAKLKDNLTDLPFVSFEKYIPAFEQNLSDFEKLFDWMIANYNVIRNVDDGLRFKDWFFIDAIIKENNPNFSHRVKLFSLFKYAELTEYSEVDKTLFMRWTRVFRNLVANTDIDNSNIGNICKSISGINNANIYKYLDVSKIKMLGFYEDQVKEEQAKARQILYGESRTDGESWEDIIKNAEKFAFFEGAIRFLFSDEKGKMNDWANFDRKWENAQKYFDENGVKKEYQVPITKALVIQCNKWDNQLYDCQLFNPVKDTWAWILTDNNWSAPVYTILVSESLDIIKRTHDCDDENVKKYITPVLAKLPFNEMIGKEPTGRFRWKDGRLGYYKPYGQNAIAFDWSDFNRNKILIGLIKEDVISTNQRIAMSGFFWGWDVNFQYKGKNFQWYRNDHVYLMDDEDQYAYLIRDEKSGEETKKFYCFSVSTDMDEVSFVRNLQKLIRQSKD